MGGQEQLSDCPLDNGICVSLCPSGDEPRDGEEYQPALAFLKEPIRVCSLGSDPREGPDLLRTCQSDASSPLSGAKLRAVLFCRG